LGWDVTKAVRSYVLCTVTCVARRCLKAVVLGLTWMCEIRQHAIKRSRPCALIVGLVDHQVMERGWAAEGP
jgi:hypothetical protein